MNSIKLISSDFDGTLIEHASRGRCSEAFAAALEAHRDRGGLWALNTGRSLQHALDGLVRFESPVPPDFLLTNEREVFRRDEEGGWTAHGEWNEHCRRRHAQLYVLATELFVTLEELTRRRSGITMIYDGELPAGLVTENERIMEEFVPEIEAASASLGHADFHYQRNTIYLRFCHRDYHKGSALEELCRLENIPTAEVFAAGDHYNDIPMLDLKYAAMIACPANAIGPVQDKVRLSTGYVSSLPWADGVAEALRYYESRPNDRLPVDDPAPALRR